MNPYEVLNVDLSATDAAIRSNYLKLVRQFPPEQYPERFAEINRAYEMVKNKQRRLHFSLFPETSLERSPMEVAINRFKRINRRVPMESGELKSYLKKCAMG